MKVNGPGRHLRKVLKAELERGRVCVGVLLVDAVGLLLVSGAPSGKMPCLVKEVELDLVITEPYFMYVGLKIYANFRRIQ